MWPMVSEATYVLPRVIATLTEEDVQKMKDVIATLTEEDVQKMKDDRGKGFSSLMRRRRRNGDEERKDGEVKMEKTKCRLFRTRPDPAEDWECTCVGCNMYWKAMDIYQRTTLHWSECLGKAEEELNGR